MRADATMTRDVIAVPPELPLTSAQALMETWRIRHLPVVQGGRVVGIVSDRDLLLRGSADGGRLVLPEGVVGEIMTVGPMTATRAMSVARIASTMIERKIDAMPIVDASDRLVGLVTSTDLLALLVEPDEEKVLPFDFRVKSTDEAGALAA